MTSTFDHASLAPDVIRDRRELAATLLRAYDSRHEVLDAIVSADTREQAQTAVAALLESSPEHAAAVLDLPIGALTRLARRRTQTELDSIDASLTWTTDMRPASAGSDVALRDFTEADLATFRSRAADQHPDWDGPRIEAELAAGLDSIATESAAWFVVEHIGTDTPVGLVFAELDGHEVDVALWVAPQVRKQGFGTAALKHARRELAIEFPGTTLVVRAAA